MFELVDVNTGNTMRTVPALEGPLLQLTGTQRAPVNSRTIAVDSAGTSAYGLTTSGLSIFSLDPPAPAANSPQVFRKGAVNAASYQTPVAQNGLVSIFGKNLCDTVPASSLPLATVLGGVCVTLNNLPLLLFLSSSGQITAHTPPVMATRYFTRF